MTNTTKYAFQHSWLPSFSSAPGYIQFANGAVRGPSSPGRVDFVSDVNEATTFDSIERALETLQQVAHNRGGWLGSISIVRVTTKTSGWTLTSALDALKAGHPLVLQWNDAPADFAFPCNHMGRNWLLRGSLVDATKYENIVDALTAVDLRAKSLSDAGYAEETSPRFNMLGVKPTTETKIETVA